MTVLLVNGRRRCDAICHNARQPKCTCICGGKNHGTSGNGKGGEEVMEKTLIVDGNIIPLAHSLEVVNHSPTGFNWGYDGSGPAQTALAILLCCAASKGEALAHYQEYKRAIIAGISQEQKVLSVNSQDVRDWLEKKRHAC